MAIAAIAFNTKNKHEEELRQFAIQKGSTNFSGYVKRLIDMDRLGMIGVRANEVKPIAENVAVSSVDEEMVELDPNLMKGLI